MAVCDKCKDINSLSKPRVVNETRPSTSNEHHVNVKQEKASTSLVQDLIHSDVSIEHSQCPDRLDTQDDDSQLDDITVDDNQSLSSLQHAHINLSLRCSTPDLILSRIDVKYNIRKPCCHQCRVCPKIFQYVSALVRHERIHTDRLPYPDRTCDEKHSDSPSDDNLSQSNKAVQHTDVNLIADLSQTDDLFNISKHCCHQCRVCLKIFQHTSSLARHQRTHTLPYPFRTWDKKQIKLACNWDNIFNYTSNVEDGVQYPTTSDTVDSFQSVFYEFCNASESQSVDQHLQISAAHAVSRPTASSSQAVSQQTVSSTQAVSHQTVSAPQAVSQQAVSAPQPKTKSTSARASCKRKTASASRKHTNANINIFCSSAEAKNRSAERQKYAHNSLMYICSACCQQFVERKEMIEHELLHRPNQSEKCFICEETFTRDAELLLQQHYRAKHRDEFSRSYKCSSCPYSTTIVKCFLSHVRVHSGARPFVCTQCGKRCLDRNRLVQHSQFMHPYERYINSLSETERAEMASRPVVQGTTSELRTVSGRYSRLRGSLQQTAAASQVTSPHRITKRRRPRELLIASTSVGVGGSEITEEHFGTSDLLKNACSMCSQQFATTTELTEHEQLHTPDPSEKCGICQETFDTAFLLHRHFRCKHRDLSTFVFRCPFCPFNSHVVGKIISHIRTHNSEKPYLCTHCRKRFTNKRQLTVHSRFTCQNARQNDCRPTNTCSCCFKKLTDAIEMTNHEQLHRPDPGDSCFMCRETFQTELLLLQHYRRKHYDISSLRFTCRVCPFTTKHIYVFISHVRLHSGERPYLCTQCGKRFIEKRRLVIHVRNQRRNNTYYSRRLHTACAPAADHRSSALLAVSQLAASAPQASIGQTNSSTHLGTARQVISALPTVVQQRSPPGLMTHVCSFCFQRFAERTKLTNHEQLHTPDASEKCGFCPEVCHSELLLQVHYWCKHTDRSSQLLTCAICPYNARRWEYFIKHVREHTGIRPYACTGCGKRCIGKRELTDHVKIIHHSYKKYKCTQCSSSFSLFKDLQLHQRMHIDELSYVCAKCGERFSTGSRLMLHVERIHNMRPMSDYAAVSQQTVLDSQAVSQQTVPAPQAVSQQTVPAPQAVSQQTASALQAVSQQSVSSHSPISPSVVSVECTIPTSAAQHPISVNHLLRQQTPASGSHLVVMQPAPKILSTIQHRISSYPAVTGQSLDSRRQAVALLTGQTLQVSGQDTGVGVSQGTTHKTYYSKPGVVALQTTPTLVITEESTLCASSAVARQEFLVKRCKAVELEAAPIQLTTSRLPDPVLVTRASHTGSVSQVVLQDMLARGHQAETPHTNCELVTSTHLTGSVFQTVSHQTVSSFHPVTQPATILHVSGAKITLPNSSLLAAVQQLASLDRIIPQQALAANSQGIAAVSVGGTSVLQTAASSLLSTTQDYDVIDICQDVERGRQIDNSSEDVAHHTNPVRLTSAQYPVNVSHVVLQETLSSGHQDVTSPYTGSVPQLVSEECDISADDSSTYACSVCLEEVVGRLNMEEHWQRH